MGPGPARSDQEPLHMTQSLKACEYKLSLLPKMASGKLYEFLQLSDKE